MLEAVGSTTALGELRVCGYRQGFRSISVSYIFALGKKTGGRTAVMTGNISTPVIK